MQRKMIRAVRLVSGAALSVTKTRLPRKKDKGKRRDDIERNVPGKTSDGNGVWMVDFIQVAPEG